MRSDFGVSGPGAFLVEHRYYMGSVHDTERPPELLDIFVFNVRVTA